MHDISLKGSRARSKVHEHLHIRPNELRHMKRTGRPVLHMCAEMPDDTQARLAASALLSTADGKSCLTKESDDGALPIKLAADVGNATTVELLSQHMPDDFDAPAVVATKKASPEQGAASTSQRSAGTSAEALQRAEIARSKGNAFFREQKYLEACVCRA